jgi:hypothetical protein
VGRQHKARLKKVNVGFIAGFIARHVTLYCCGRHVTL